MGGIGENLQLPSDGSEILCAIRAPHKTYACQILSQNMSYFASYGEKWVCQILKIWVFFLRVMYLDFKKAFDSVPHIRLLQKLKAYGVEGDLLNWIQHFLVGRTQRVSVNGTLSVWVIVLGGIPPGECIRTHCVCHLHQRSTRHGQKYCQDICRWHQNLQQDLKSRWSSTDAGRS